MYKAFLILISLLICSIKNYSQSDTTTSLWIDISRGTPAEVYYNTNWENYGWHRSFYQPKSLVTPSIVFNKHSHSILLGPRLYLPETNYHRFGAQLSYEFNPIPSRKYNPLPNSIRGIVMFNIIYSYENYKNRVVKNRLSFLPSVGVKTYLTSNLYSNLSMGMGVGFTGSIYELEVMIRFGIGYKIKFWAQSNVE